MAPASRTTSPPIVVGRKLFANKPVNVSAVERESGMSTFPERSKIYQRADTNNLDMSTSTTPARIRVHEICLSAATISSQPPSRTSTTISTTASSVPPSRSSRLRSLRSFLGMVLFMRKNFPHCVGQLLLGFMVSAGQQLRHQAHQHGLEAEDQKHHGKLEERRPEDPHPFERPPQEEIEQSQPATKYEY